MIDRITHWKNLAKAAFVDAATMPFALPQNIYDVKKSAGTAEEVAAHMREDAKLAVNMAAFVGVLYGIVGLLEGQDPALTTTQAAGIPYAMLLLAAGASTYVVNKDPQKSEQQKKTFQRYFWPNVTEVMERRATQKDPSI